MKVRRCVAAVAGVMMLLAGSASIATAFRGRPVFVAYRACTRHAVRPSQIVLACGDAGFFATHVVFRSYGGKTAVARAQLNVHNCVPNCAQSRFHAFPGTLTLTDVVRCGDGRYYYSRAKYRFTGTNPDGPSSGVANIEPFIRCSNALG